MLWFVVLIVEAVGQGVHGWCGPCLQQARMALALRVVVAAGLADVAAAAEQGCQEVVVGHPV